MIIKETKNLNFTAKTKLLGVFVSENFTKAEITTCGIKDSSILNTLETAKKEKVFTGKKGQKLWANGPAKGPFQTLVIGLGKSPSSEDIRIAAANFYAQANTDKKSDTTIVFCSNKSTKLEKNVRALAEGFILRSYNFNDLKKDSKENKETITILNSTGSKTISKAIKEANVLGEMTNFARWLGDMPGNLMTPTILAKSAQSKAKGTKLKITVWDEKRIKKEKMESFLGVSRGSSEPARFIIMEHKGGPASQTPICFVGKGLTFDAGGISLKPSKGMEDMKYDMCGGAAVISAMIAISKLNLPINVTAYVPSSENMPGPAANKPGDVRIARNGLSIEVNNTDAEGRLILADALVYASEKKPKWICSIATLTGAMVVALGNLHTGFFTESEKLSKLASKASSEANERTWPMPLISFHKDDMKGTYADLSNTSSGYGAGSATAAAFLTNFIEKEVPYLHFDIAGTAWHGGGRASYNPKKGATGAIVRTLVEMARSSIK